MTTVPLNPEGAAMHAVLVQGGFSTPAIEAFRILTDALRRTTLDAEWQQGVRDTLAWLDAHEGPEVAHERERFQRKHGPDWRERLEAPAPEQVWTVSAHRDDHHVTLSFPYSTVAHEEAEKWRAQGYLVTVRSICTPKEPRS